LLKFKLGCRYGFLANQARNNELNLPGYGFWYTKLGHVLVKFKWILATVLTRS